MVPSPQHPSLTHQLTPQWPAHACQYLDQEEGDEGDGDGEIATAWHRFASREYILLSSEEDDDDHTDDDDDDDDDDDGDEGFGSLHSPLVKY